MAAALSGGVPAKLEKKPVKFSNLLCELNAGVTYKSNDAKAAFSGCWIKHV